MTPAANGSTIVRTMCPMNCHPTLCGMLVETREGHLIGVKGDPDNPGQPGLPVHPRPGRAGDFRQPGAPHAPAGA